LDGSEIQGVVLDILGGDLASLGTPSRGGSGSRRGGSGRSRGRAALVLVVLVVLQEDMFHDSGLSAHTTELALGVDLVRTVVGTFLGRGDVIWGTRG